MGKTIQLMGLTFLVLIMLMAVFVLLAPKLGWRIDTVLSSSMTPYLKAGSLVVTRPVDTDDIKVGDIITFSSPIDGKILTHRVIGIEKTNQVLFQTRGDANEDTDPFLAPAKNVMGVICFHSPILGYVTQFIKSKVGLALLLFLPGLIIILIELRNIWQALSEMQVDRKYRVS